MTGMGRGILRIPLWHLTDDFDTSGNKLRFLDLKILEVTYIKVSNPSSARRAESKMCYSIFTAEVAAIALLGHPCLDLLQETNFGDLVHRHIQVSTFCPS